MRVINVTPHDVDICDEHGNVIKTYKASGVVARISHGWDEIDYVDDIPVVVRKGEKVIDLPRPHEGIMYIVSNIVLDYCTDRTDLLAPVKQFKIGKRVIGCRAFAGNKKKS